MMAVDEKESMSVDLDGDATDRRVADHDEPRHSHPQRGDHSRRGVVPRRINRTRQRDNRS
jgi:hypothetical protein